MSARIAIIGLAHRLPGTSDGSFWDDLVAGHDLTGELPTDRWNTEAYYHPRADHPGTMYATRSGSIPDPGQFDAPFFNISPREAAHMDPQQRVLLELAWESMEDAGVPPAALSGSQCGVFVGVSATDYAHRNSDDAAVIDTPTATGNTSSIVSNRLSYFFDLHGPSMSIDTACSSALVAFHQAAQSIRTGETTTALTGGVSLHLHPLTYVLFSKANMLSPSGHCHAFDEQADGYARSEGAGIFLLKEYEAARADNDPILATVPASAVNSDGRTSSLTVPNPDAQAELMRRTYERAGISPDEIDYVEAHGTGTAVGDPIEVQAIGAAIGQQRATPLPIGSIKANLGHLESAAGVASLVKALESIRHRALVPTPGVQSLNPAIDFAGWNIEVPTEHRPLASEKRLVIGVNGFGFGGANAHVILEGEATTQTGEQPASQQTPANQPRNAATVVRITARDADALADSAQQIAGLLEAPDARLYDVAFNLYHRREHLEHGLALIADTAADCASALATFADSGPDSEAESAEIVTGQRLPAANGPVLVFTGNGCQWSGMGRELLDTSEAFAAAVDEVDQLFAQHTDVSLRDVLEQPAAPQQLASTEIAQPALFALQVGLTRMLAVSGIAPRAVVGHSVGEVAAAWASGALDLPQAVRVIFHRSACQERTRGLGGMTAVAAGSETVQPIIDEAHAAVEVAATNSTRGVTLSGTREALALIEQRLDTQGIRCQRLDLDYAFHSPFMDDLRSPLESALADIQPGRAEIPFISTVTGAAVTADVLDGHYWWRNIREPVQFGPAIDTLVADGANVFIEVGAHPILSRYVHDVLGESRCDGRSIATLVRDEAPDACMRRSVARYTIAGGPLDTAAWFPTNAPHVDLPRYPWQHARYWLEDSGDSDSILRTQDVHPLLGHALPRRAPGWEQHLDTATAPWLDDHRVGGTTVFPGAGFVELALAAAATFSEASDILDIENLEIHEALALDSKRRKQLQTRRLERGQLAFFAREIASDVEWRQHASARLTAATAGRLLTRRLPQQPERTPDFTREHHTSRARALGLEYGPAFQAIRHGWRSADEVVGVIDADNSARFHLDPAILDGAFQLFIPLLEQTAPELESSAFVPVRIERIQCRSGAAAPRFARLVLRSRGPYSLAADFELYDAHGQAVAVAAGARFQAVRLQQEHARALSYLDQRLVPAPRVAGTAMLDNPGYLEAQAELSRTWRTAAQANYTSEIEPLLDTLAASFAYESLQRLANGNRLAPAPNTPNGQNPRQSELFDGLGQLLADMGWLEVDDAGWTLLEPEEPITAQAVWRLLVQDYPAAFALTHRIGRVGRHLDAALTNATDSDQPTRDSELRPGLSLELPTRDTWRRTGDALSAAVHAARGAMRRGDRLSVLEANSAGPELLRRLVAGFDFDTGELRFIAGTDEAEREAGQLAERYPQITVQAATSASEDSDSVNDRRVQLALLVADPTSLERTRQMLASTQDQLTSDAQIIVLGIEPSRWLDLVLPDMAPTTRHDVWRLLEQSGMHNIAAQPSTDENGDRTEGAYVLSARAAKTNTHAAASNPATWLLVHDQRSADLAAEISRQIEAGQDQHVVHQSMDDDSRVAAKDSLADGEMPDHVIDVRDLERGSHPTNPVDRCERVRDWHTVLESHASETGAADTGGPTFWALTTGSAVLFTDADGAGDIEDTALWGLGRSLQNESVHVELRLVDLPPRAGGDGWSEATIHALGQELLAPNAETEVVFDANGARFAPRLHERAPPEIAKHPASDPYSSAALVFSQPGRLTSLEWRQRPLAEPTDGEVVVRVEATGLNFRDVMYTLGLLSDEALEGGFSGATLGLEFAGRIEQSGAKVDDFAVGDRVLGFGPASFSERVTTRTESIATIPDTIDTQAAATIPTAFFTAYYGLVHLARLAPGERVLIHGAAGGVGIAAIQIAQWLGAEVYASVGSAPKRDFVRLLGVERIYDSRGLTFAEEILHDTPDGRGVDVILNSLAGEAIEQNLRVLNPFGRFLELGKRDFYENTAMGLRPFRSNLSYFGVDADQLLKEKPAQTRWLFSELMSLFADGTLAPLPYTTFGATEVVEAYRHMQQSRQIGKIVVAQDQTPTADASSDADADADTAPSGIALANDATYLVTGGLSGFGLRTASWLAENGARHLLLIGRRGNTTSEAKQSIEALEAAGVQVRTAACDVGDRAALERVLADCETHGPPLRGIVHAAAVIEDGVARNLDRDQLAKVMAPKIEGARHLDSLTRHCELDFFVLYSSATTLFGTPGQSNYVAANTWLEGLAAERRRHGLPATCVCWGAIEDAGFLARNPETRDALQKRLGGPALRVDEALPVLADFMAERGQTAGVLHLDWATLGRTLPTHAAPRFRALSRRHAGEMNETTTDADWSALLAEGATDEIRAALYQLLRAEMADIFFMKADTIDFQCSFERLGMDSLMGFELMSALQARIGASLPEMILSEAKTPEQLVERLAERLGSGESAESNDDDAALSTMLSRHGIEDDVATESARESSDV